MNGIVTNNISFILVFLEGVLSFFSPCVIPLLPVYMGYLAGSAKEDKDGVITYQRKKVFYHTIFFVIGISFAFLLLGTSFTLLGKMVGNYKYLFIRISGILIIILGLFQLGVFRFSFLQKERKINLNLAERNVNPMVAFLLGFTFSFAWTPCIGPALSSVLILASGAKTAAIGYLLVLVYAIGFVLPFLLLGLFTTQVLNFFKRKQKLIQYTIKAGGIILIIIGLMTFTGFMNGISSYLNTIPSNNNSESGIENKEVSESSVKDNEVSESSVVDNEVGESSIEASESGESSDTKTNTTLAFDFTLVDQNGNEHTLFDYKGKVVFLNFYATWCPPCNEELPDIEKLYKEYGSNQGDVVFLGITNPKSKDFPNNADEDEDYIKSFLNEKDYTFPTLFDTTGEILQKYGISAFPTTFIFDKEGNMLGYVPGMMTEDIMKKVIGQALEKE